MVQKWDIFVRETLPPEAMWYPPIKVEWDKMIPLPDKPGKHRNIALAKRIKKLSQETGVPYKSPHKFRHGHAVFALMQARTMADYKAISQNLMHDNIKVTDSVYAWMKNDEVRQRIVRMSDDMSYPPIQDDELEAYLNGLSKSDLKQAIILGANLLAG